jgi:hypothetical protein
MPNVYITALQSTVFTNCTLAYVTNTSHLKTRQTAFIGCQFVNTTARTFTGSFTRFIACNFAHSLTITGNINKFADCFVGSDGAAKTYTVDTGAVGNKFDGCTTEAAIVDNGTDTILVSNNVFV